MTVRPFLLSSMRTAIISSPVLESRLPVGSSAIIMGGSFIIALAIRRVLLPEPVPLIFFVFFIYDEYKYTLNIYST